MPSKKEYEELEKSYTDSKGEFLDRFKKYRLENLEKARESARLSKQKSRSTPEKKKVRNSYERGVRLMGYGLTFEDYDNLMDRQGGVCAICGRPPLPSRNLDIDHEHRRGYKNYPPDKKKKFVRGLLCHRCNRAVGLMGNSLPDLMYAAANFDSYMKRYYADTIIGELGYDEAVRVAKNAYEYLKAHDEKK